MGIDEILKERREEILRIAAKHGARDVRVFGSVARGEADARSDVDFLVEMEAESTLLDVVGIIQDLEDLLGRSVHVVEREAVHWYIRDQVINEAVPL